MKWNKDIKSFIAFFSGGLICLVAPISLPQNEIVIRYTNVFYFLGLSYFFSSFSFLFNHLKLAERERVSKIILSVGFSIIIIGVLMRFAKLMGAIAVIIIGSSIIAFTYPTILSTIRKEKWEGFAKKKWQILLLRFGDISGIGLLISGILGKYLNWSFSEIFLIMGAILLTSSLIVWNRLFSNEVVLRKKAEEDLQKAFNELQNQHRVIEEKNKEILDSLHYAKRIQTALMPNEKYITKNLKQKESK